MLATLLSTSLAVDPNRVHLVDAYPRGNPHNFLFRGNNPVTDSKFDLDALMAILRQKALTACNATLPTTFRFIDLDLENPTDPGYFVERQYWADHPEQGEVISWPILGTLTDVKHPVRPRDELIQNGSWAIQGDADHLPQRLAATRTLLLNTTGPMKVLYAHCNAGCDRTGEFVGAYAMSHLGYNITTAMGEACKQCGRCPNFFATESLGWWCLTLQAEGRTDVGDCLNAFGCKYAGDCDAHSPTPLADDCPRP